MNGLVRSVAHAVLAFVVSAGFIFFLRRDYVLGGATTVAIGTFIGCVIYELRTAKKPGRRASASRLEAGADED